MNAEKVPFNPHIMAHIKRYARFLSEGKWGKDKCPFILEEPFTSIPEMCNYRVIRYYLKPFMGDSKNV